MRIGKFSLAVALAVAGLATGAQAVVIDGVVTPAEYAGAASIHDTTPTFNQNQTRYLATDGSTLYYALKLDTPSDMSALPFVNAYLYSSSANNLVPGPGTGNLDGGDDYIFETSSTGGDVRTFNGPDSTLVGNFTTSTSGGVTFLDYAPLNILAAIDVTTGDFEMSIPKTVVNADSYDSLRWGVQNYGFNFGTYSNVVAGVVPEPASLGLLGAAATLLLGRRRSAK